MKPLILTLMLGIFAASVTLLTAEERKKTTTTKTENADGSTTTETTTTTSTGTLSEYAPGTTFVVKETSGPVTYHYGKKVVYVTKSGKEIPEAEVKTRIRVGVPVSVHYVTEGENRVIRRVVIDD